MPTRRRDSLLTYLVVGPFAIFLAFPFYWMLQTSLKSERDLYNVENVPFSFGDGSPTLDNYRFLFSDTQYARWLLRYAQKEEEATAAFVKVLRLDPTFSGAHLHLAQIAYSRGELIETRAHLRGEILLRPLETDVLLSLANLLMDTGESRAAVACLRRLVTLDRDNPSAWINLAVAQFNRGRYEHGIDACLMALSCEPENTVAMYNLALAYEHLGKFDEAMHWIRKGLGRDPSDTAFQKLEFRIKVLRIRSRVVRGVRTALRLSKH